MEPLLVAADLDQDATQPLGWRWPWPCAVYMSARVYAVQGYRLWWLVLYVTVHNATVYRGTRPVSTLA